MEVTVHELNLRTAKVMAVVERGGTVTVTKDGHRVAVILPLDLAEPRYPFRTDPMGDDLADMPSFRGGSRILDDLDGAMEGFGE
ncbi:type II toxin-antitoxin system prevent-host-death family antitoxin [Kitasatospora purpeofusca]|uniref:type II toxin-antitoxin system Phd/YefM family antitoxin n=1 Tax=Kitasatospora purpeofusca TaxID=67352 RepID=UPI00224DDE5C|nr:type II toxin-antitoxin system prevent-host-death family antitoxin [Kitasatospora purpeofusca]MCX4685841.1 type II toxin-antitoxin system prevent-host-death family antitoxin [Kitasatospora purpeofusca]